MKLSFCETAAAGGLWHIRRLTDQGKKLGGGADTRTLCGREAAWDVQFDFSPVRLDELEKMVPRYGRPCPACVEVYRAWAAKPRGKYEGKPPWEAVDWSPDD
jgi:hypothetical protein